MRLLERARREDGWTMVEAQLAMVIVGILTTGAAPSALDFADEVYRIAATSNLRTAAPAVEAFHLDNGTYSGLDLTLYDPRVRVETDDAQNTATTYCIYAKAGKFTFFERGPFGEIVEDPTPDASPCA